MNRRADLWEEAARAAAEHRKAALATVSRQRGSVPMASDAKMLVDDGGRRLGTVGGGCVEAEVIHEALSTIETGQPAIVRHSLNADVAGDIGLSCGGTVDLFVEPIVPTPSFVRLCTAIGHGIRRRAAITVLTGLDWKDEPAKLARVGGEVLAVGAGNPEWLDAPPSANRSPTFVDESRSLFVERVPRPPRVIIFGAGHVGAEIARLAAGAGFFVVIADDRAEFANRERIPAADEVLVGDFGTVLDELHIDPDDFVLATTRGHSYDAYIVERTAGSPAQYVGMLGSKRKRSVIWKALEKSGVPRASLERVRSPIGLEIGADNPAEIAVSVVAELIQIRRRAESGQ